MRRFIMAKKIKIPKWRSSINAISALDWILLNQRELIEFVNNAEFSSAEAFSQKLKSILDFELVNTIEREPCDIESQLSDLFNTISPSLEKKIEIRYRAYAYRKQKRIEELKGNSVIKTRDTQRTWVTQKQTVEMLKFLYERLDSFELKRNFFNGDDIVRVQFVQGILNLNSQLRSKSISDEVLHQELSNLIQKSIRLTEWRKFKILYRSEKSSLSRGVQTIKVDEQAKKLLERVKRDNKLATLSDAIMHLAKSRP